MQTPTKSLLLLAVLAVAAFVWAQQAGTEQPITVKLTLGVTDDRWIKLRIDSGLTNQSAWRGMIPGYFTRNKNFTLIIRDLNKTEGLSRFYDFRYNFITNETGYVQFDVKVFSGEVRRDDGTWRTSRWYVALVLNDWPEKGYQWLVYNATINKVTILDVLYCLGGDQPRGPIIGTHDDCKNSRDTDERAFWTGSTYWGNVTRFATYAVINSSAIHLWFLRVPRVGNMELSVDIKYRIGTKEFILYSTERNATLTNRLPGLMFGPFYYLGSLVRNLGDAGEMVRVDRDTVRRLDVTVKARVKLNDKAVETEVIKSTNNLDPDYPVKGYRLPWEARTYDYSRRDTVPIEGGIVVKWEIPAVSVTIESLYDLKGNPVLLPEYITLKAQVKIGDTWVEMSTAQVTWNPTLKNLRDVLVQVCSDRGITISTLKDLMDCYRSITKDDFKFAVEKLYRSATLSFAVGQLVLTDNRPEIKTEAGITAKIVAEYFYPESGATASAVVGVYPIVMEKPGSITIKRLAVALLPVAIRLYQYDDNRLPNGIPLTITSALTNLRFRIEGGGLLFDKIGLQAVVKNPWNNTIMLALPPYEVPPLMVGGEKLHPLSFFNSSGYLPLSPLYGAICISANNVEYYNVTDIESRKRVDICKRGQPMNLLTFFSQYTQISSSQRYKIEVYLGDVRVGIAYLESGKYNITSTGQLDERRQDNVETALRARFNVLQADVDRVRAVYNAEVSMRVGRLYSVQHYISMAVAAITLNILPRDLCGSTLPGGTLRIVVRSDSESYVQDVSMQRNQFEVPVPLALPVDETGLVARGYLELSAYLQYFGYSIPAVNKTTLEQAVVKIPVRLLPQAKPELNFAVSPLLFSVWSITPEGNRKERLSGFVVSVYSTKLNQRVGEMSRSISNLTRWDNPISDKYGYAYVEGVPINYTFRVVVRTIIPVADSKYPYTLAQILRRNSYDTYSEDMRGGSAGSNVYTLGTRGPVDQGVVVFDKTMILTPENFTRYACGREDIPLPVKVYDLRVKVYDKTGNYLLNSTEVFFGPYPLASAKRRVPVVIVIPDTNKYEDSSRVYVSGGTTYPYIQTSYAVIGLSGLRDVYKRTAQEYFELMRRAACQRPVDWRAAVYNYSFAAFYNYVAEVSSDTPNAIYTISSVQPKFVPSVCDMSADVPGAREYARLFLHGQRYRFQVWYLGYKVFDGWVTINSTEVKLLTDAVPVKFETYTKSFRLPVDTYVGVTFADALAGVAGDIPTGITTLIEPFNYMSPIGVNQILDKDPERVNVYYSPSDVSRNNDVKPYGRLSAFRRGIEYSLPWAVMVFRNLTDPASAGISRERRIYYPSDGVIHGALLISGSEYIAGLPRWIRTIEGNEIVYYYSKPVFQPYDLSTPTYRLIEYLMQEKTKPPSPVILNYDSIQRLYIGRTVLKTYDSNSRVFELLTYRTLSIEVPYAERCYVGAGESGVVEVKNYAVTLTVEARFASNNTLIDKVTYDLSRMVAGTVEERPIVHVPLLFGKVAGLAKYVHPDRNDGVEIMFEFKMEVREGDRRVKYGQYCKGAIGDSWTAHVSALIPAEVYFDVRTAGSRWITTDGRVLPSGKYTIYTTEVYKYVNATSDLEWTVVAAVPHLQVDAVWRVQFGFGAPLTVEFKAGDVVVLPAWTSASAGYGSRIARIWLYTYVKDHRVKVVNFVPSVNGWKIVQTYRNEFSDTGSGDIWGLGFLTSGTSSVVYSAIGLAGKFGGFDYSTYKGYAFWNSTELAEITAKIGAVKLPTIALDELEIANVAKFPIVVTGVKIVDNATKVTKVIDAMSPTRLETGQKRNIELAGYSFGTTYDINMTRPWNFSTLPNAPCYAPVVYYGGYEDAVKFFRVFDPTLRTDYSKLTPLSPRCVVQNTLYESHHRSATNSFTTARVRVVDRTPAVVTESVTNATRGTWKVGDIELVSRSDGFAFRFIFDMPTLPLVEVRDWNDRPLARQTVALFAVVERSGVLTERLFAVVHTDSDGRLKFPLPNLCDEHVRTANSITRGGCAIIRVGWFYGYLRTLATGEVAYTIWIYDSAVKTDVEQLGNASYSPKIRTWVYPLAVTVRDVSGRPLVNMWVRVVDENTDGRLVNAENRTGADGTTRVFDPRVSTYPSGFLSQVPATGYLYYVYDETGVLVATGTYSIQRGATQPAAGWNIVATVMYLTEIRVKNSATRGVIKVKDVEFLNGTRKDLTIPFKVENGVMKLAGKLPVSVGYPVEIYVTHVTLGGQEIPVKGGEYLVFRGKTTDLLAGLDFAELGLTGIVTIQAVDATGTPRSDWTIQVLYGDITVVQGQGQLQAVLPRTDVLGDAYKIRLITNAVTPDGKPLVKEQTLALNQKALALKIPVSTVKVILQAVDGFGAVRNDWPVAVENVATGMGQITTELIEGEQYVARVTALGFTNTTTFTARGPQMVIRVKIPTAKIEAQVVDGFGAVRNEWSVQIVGVVSGQGKVGPVEVLGGQQYTVKTVVFGKEFSQTVNVPVGQSVTATVQVPTARLSITAVDEEKKPIDRYVTSVELTGSLNLMYSTPPKDLEVLAGTYNIKVAALGRDATSQITLNAGETKNIQIVVPGTTGLDFMGTRITISTLVLYGLLLLVIIVILAILIIEYNNWRRRRLMQILAPPK
jgi:hypothetical protein